MLSSILKLETKEKKMNFYFIIIIIIYIFLVSIKILFLREYVIKKIAFENIKKPYSTSLD